MIESLKTEQFTYYPTSVDYDASKSALISLTYDSAVQFAPYVRVTFLASEDASFVNSTVIKVDGGWY